MRKKYFGLICIIYSLIILYCWIFNKLSNFLAPTMQLYIKLSFIPLLIIGIVLLISKDHNSIKVSDLFLLLPILLLIIAGDGKLSTSFATNRMVSNKTIKENKEVKKDTSQVKESYSKLSEQYDFTKPFFDINDPTYSELSGYITFSPKAEQYAGKTIRVRGFALSNHDIVPKGYYALGKYVVSCCVADASFSGFIIKDDTNTIKNNKWYEIEGVLEPGIDNTNNSMMYINVINIKEIDSKKETQYVYPCYSYGNNKCDEINKYDLK